MSPLEIQDPRTVGGTSTHNKLVPFDVVVVVVVVVVVIVGDVVFVVSSDDNDDAVSVAVRDAFRESTTESSRHARTGPRRAEKRFKVVERQASVARS